MSVTLPCQQYYDASNEKASSGTGWPVDEFDLHGFSLDLHVLSKSQEALSLVIVLVFIC